MEGDMSLLSSSETTNIQNSTSIARGVSEPVKSPDDGPVDWFEPLEEDCEEDDDTQSWDRDGLRDAEVESLAGESEKSGSIAGSERNYQGRAGGGGGALGKRKLRFGSDDGWEDCPDLGTGWKRRVVLRRSGMSVGQRDVYYISPRGERVRSRIELQKAVGNTLDLTNFDYKTGAFVDGKPPRKVVKKRKMDSPAEYSFSSESSFNNETAEAYDRTYSPGLPCSLRHFAQQKISPYSSQKDFTSVPSPGPSNENQALIIQTAANTRQNVPSNAGVLSQTLKVPANPEDRTAYISSNAYLCVCVRCRNAFVTVEGQTMCEQCNKACSASKDNRNITFRKWLPCGFCEACQITEDCGVCASCRTGKLNQRLIRCRKRKCMCPSLKRKADVPPLGQCGSVVHKPERVETINMVSKFSDSDDQSSFYEDNNSEVLVRKSRRTCGQCKGCLTKSDCGACDYCIDKPKFGGSNKKRQKCRQRQCQREAPGWSTPGRPKLHYTYSHKVLLGNGEKWDFEFSDNECEKERMAKSYAGVRYVDRDKDFLSDYGGQDGEIKTSQALSEDHLLHLFCNDWPRVKDKKWRRPPGTERRAEQPDEDEMEPMITQIFSLGGDNAADDGLDLELLELLESLRDAPLPVLWCAVMAEGPHLQLLQCSKLSAMVDTTVQIEPSFHYHISVQGQPLLPTHWLYHAHPARLTSAAHVARLLEDLERYSVCRGFKNEPHLGTEPIVQVRAATCEFLVDPATQCCARCRSAQQKHGVYVTG